MGANIDPNWKYRELQAAASKDREAKEVRQLGKVGNLSCQYRIGAKSLLRTARVNYGMGIDLSEAELIHRTYHQTYPGIKLYWKRKVREAQHAGYAVTIAGRRVKLSGNWSGDTAWQLESTAVNFPVQGIGADQKYLAMRCITPLLTKYAGMFYFELHDGLYAIFPNAVADKAAREGSHILSNLPYKKAWGFTPPIPLPWDTKIGPNWGDLKELAI
jgi:DNA polymerase I-like protein with 3'-5' exonuclease and polymerase domains